MIDRVHFENFKSLADVTIDLGRFTVLVGPNGCGKSSVLQAMHLHSQTGLERGEAPGTAQRRLGRFDYTFSGPRSPARLAREGEKAIVLSARAGDPDMDELTVRLVPSDANTNVEVSLVGRRGRLSTRRPQDDVRNAATVLNHPRTRAFTSCVYLRPNATRMTETTVPEDESPRTEYDGYGLASVLAWMKGAAEDELAGITVDLARVVPGVKRIRTLREKIVKRDMERITIDGQPVWRPVDNTFLGDRFELEFDNGDSIPADLLSEGTVLALGLLTKLREPGRPRLVLLDDIDRALHLSAQAELVTTLRGVLENQAGLQIVCTTHSPYLLDLFKPEEVRVMALDSERRTRVRPLSDHPDMEQWKFGTQTGELWATLGEAWVLEAGGG